LIAALDAIKESGIDLRIQQCDLTDRKMYIAFTCPEIEVQAKELLKSYKVPSGSSLDGNKGIVTGFVIGNSEIGHGSFYVTPRAVILACRNGLTFTRDSFSKIHLGSKLETFHAVSWSEDVKQKNYELICLQVRDAVKAFCSKDYLQAKVNELEKKNTGEITNKVDVIRNISKEMSFEKEKEDKLLSYFLSQNDTSPFGVSQAITLYANRDAKNPDEQYEMEETAMSVFENIKKYDTEFKGKK
jgi:hypothetical protein